MVDQVLATGTIIFIPNLQIRVVLQICNLALQICNLAMQICKYIHTWNFTNFYFQRCSRYYLWLTLYLTVKGIQFCESTDNRGANDSLNKFFEESRRVEKTIQKRLSVSWKNNFKMKNSTKFVSTNIELLNNFGLPDLIKGK